MLDRPIILVGTQRSGTTWLGGIFSRHPDLAYWSEPRHIWTWGNSYQPDDLLTAKDARPEVVRHIRRKFERFVWRHGKSRLCEKTPSNCLRMQFVRAVFPDARMLLVVRDGRSVIRSTQAVMKTNVPLWRIAWRAVQTPLWEWPAYLPQAAGVLGRKLTGRPLEYWGPHPPGWNDWLHTDPTEVVLAKQWSATISRAIADAESIGPDDCFVFRYEQLMSDPRRIMSQIVEYCELANTADLVNQVVATADPARQAKWRASLDTATLDLIRPHMEPSLRRLGYSW